MNASKGFSLRRVLVLMAMVVGSMVTTLSAYGQEVDPTWYDPWSPPNAAVVHHAQPQVAAHKAQRKAKLASSQRTAKLRGKRATTQTKPS